MTDKNTLKSYFKTGDRPTQSQFYAGFDSYWHKSETLPLTQISGLNEILLEKADSSVVVNLAENVQQNTKTLDDLQKKILNVEFQPTLGAQKVVDIPHFFNDEIEEQEAGENETVPFFANRLFLNIKNFHEISQRNPKIFLLVYSPRKTSKSTATEKVRRRKGGFKLYCSRTKSIPYSFALESNIAEISLPLANMFKVKEDTVMGTNGKNNFWTNGLTSISWKYVNLALGLDAASPRQSPLVTVAKLKVLAFYRKNTGSGTINIKIL